jgi:DNA-binding NarL/FixJ family response regulator
MLVQSLVLLGLPKKLHHEFTFLAQLLALTVQNCNNTQLHKTLSRCETLDSDRPLIVHYLPHGASQITNVVTGHQAETFKHYKHLALCNGLTVELEIMLIEAGFRGAIDESYPVEDKIQAIKTVQQDEICFTTTAMSHYILRKKPQRTRAENQNIMTLTTPKEQQIISLIWRGFTNDEVAQTLSISVNTVKMHVQNIYKKTNIKNRGQLHALAHGH